MRKSILPIHDTHVYNTFKMSNSHIPTATKGNMYMYTLCSLPIQHYALSKKDNTNNRMSPKFICIIVYMVLGCMGEFTLSEMGGIQPASYPRSPWRFPRRLAEAGYFCAVHVYNYILGVFLIEMDIGKTPIPAKQDQGP